MGAGKWNIEIEQGATWVRTLVIEDSDGLPRELTGYAARMQIRPLRAVEDADPLLELTVANGRVVLTPAAGMIVLTLTAAVTAGLDFGTAYHDLEIEAGGVVERVLEGLVVLDKEWTV